MYYLHSELFNSKGNSLPEARDRFNEKSLIRGVREVEFRTNGRAIEVGVLLHEETAFQTSVNSVDTRFLTGGFSVSSNEVLGERRFHVRFPTRVAKKG